MQELRHLHFVLFRNGLRSATRWAEFDSLVESLSRDSLNVADAEIGGRQKITNRVFVGGLVKQSRREIRQGR